MNTLPSLASTKIFEVVSAKNEVCKPSSPLNVAVARSATWPFIARIQPFCDTTMVSGSRSIIAWAKSATMTSGAASKLVRRRPSAVSGPNFFLTSRISTAIICHCFFSLASSASIVAFSRASSSCSLRSAISSRRRRLLSRVSST